MNGLRVSVPGSGFIRGAEVTPDYAFLDVAGVVLGLGKGPDLCVRDRLVRVTNPDALRRAAAVLTEVANEMERLRALAEAVRSGRSPRAVEVPVRQGP